MWKKDEGALPSPPAPRIDERQGASQPARSLKGPNERATIGPSITVRGEVGGDEDLLIQGRVEGSVDLKQQSVTVGQQGRVKADIEGRVVTVEGEVEGNLRAHEQVILRSSARVQGDITAPRVVLEDGASFQGLVDMGDPFKERAEAGRQPQPHSRASKTAGEHGPAEGGLRSGGSPDSPEGSSHPEKMSAEGKKGTAEAGTKVQSSATKTPA